MNNEKIKTCDEFSGEKFTPENKHNGISTLLIKISCKKTH